MNKSRVVSCILAVLFMFLLAGCGFIGEQRYTCDVENVKTVQLMKLGDFDEESHLFQHIVICEVEDYVPFIERLLSIKQVVHWGTPGSFFTGDIVIYIEYENGDYDRISSVAQTGGRNGKNVSVGHVFFDNKQFIALLNDYLPEDEQIH